MHASSQRGAYGASQRPNNSGSSGSTPAIRAGLSVQELKAMTAMRMASADETAPAQVIIPPQRNSAAIASSYQTATPQQLLSAGILPVVINDRSHRSRHNRNHPSNGNGSSNHSGARNNGLSPYHQQLLPRRHLQQPERFDNYGRNHEPRLAPLTESVHPKFGSAFSEPPIPDSAFGNAGNGLNGGRQYHRNRDYLSMQVQGHNMLGNHSMGSTQHIRPPADMFDFREPRVPEVEVRSPPMANHFTHPDEHSEHYHGDVHFQANHGYHHHGGRVDLLKDSLSMLTMASNEALQRHPLNKSRTQSTLDPSALSSFQEEMFRPIGGRPQLPVLSQLDMREPNECVVNESAMDRNGRTTSPKPSTFPLIKSKTAPKLSGIDSPSSSPSMKLLARKLLGSSNKDLRINCDNVLPDEMAEAVLGTPPSTSSPSRYNAKRLSNSSSRSPLTFPAGGFFGGTDCNDNRFAWDVALEEDESAPIDGSFNECAGLSSIVEEPASSNQRESRHGNRWIANE